MEQGAQVRVLGPSRVLLAVSTGALVAVTSAATAVVVLHGTGGGVPGQELAPRPPVAAAPGRPPVVVLPPGAFGTAVPALVSGSRPGPAADRGAAAAPRRTGGSSLVLSMAPELSAPALVPAGGLLAPRPRLPRISPPPAVPAPPLPRLDEPAARPGERRGALKDEPVLAAPSDSLAGSSSLLLTPSGDEEPKRPPAVSGVSPTVAASPAAVERRAAGAGRKAATSATRGTSAARKSPARKSPATRSSASTRSSATTGERATTTSASNGKKKKASGSSSGGRAPQGGRGSGRGARS